LYPSWIGATLWLSGDRQGATKELHRAMELDSLNPVALHYVARIALESGDTAAARRASNHLPKFSPWNGMAADAYGRLGDRGKVDSIARAIERASPWFGSTALAYAALGVGDTASALTRLEAAARAGEYWAAVWPVRDPIFNPIRRSERFLALVHQAGLDARQLAPP
jgi:hypothetical protein